MSNLKNRYLYQIFSIILIWSLVAPDFALAQSFCIRQVRFVEQEEGSGGAGNPNEDADARRAAEQNNIKKWCLFVEMRELYHRQGNNLVSCQISAIELGRKYPHLSREAAEVNEKLKNLSNSLKEIHDKVLDPVFLESLAPAEIVKQLQDLSEEANVVFSAVTELEKTDGETEEINRIKDKLNKFRAAVQDVTETIERPLEFKAINLNEVIEEARHKVGVDSKYSEVECILELSSDRAIESFPSYFRSVWLHLFENLLENAVFHGLILKPGEFKKGGKIKVISRREENNIVIQVTDNGKGMPEEALEVLEPGTGKQRVFTEQYSEWKKHGPFHGLGLALCWDIVSAHGGRIRVDSKLNVGTTFTIELPTKPGQEMRTTQATSPHPRGGGGAVCYDMHDGCLKELRKLKREGLIPEGGVVLLNFDCHDDRSSSESTLPDEGNWIKHAQDEDLVKELIWIRPPWRNELAEGYKDDSISLEELPQKLEEVRALLSEYPVVTTIDFDFYQNTTYESTQHFATVQEVEENSQRILGTLDIYGIKPLRFVLARSRHYVMARAGGVTTPDIERCLLEKISSMEIQRSAAAPAGTIETRGGGQGVVGDMPEAGQQMAPADPLADQSAHCN